MRVVYVTFNMPYWYPEAYLIQEALALMATGNELLIVPVRPRGSVLHHDARGLLEHTVKRPLISFDILCAALVELIQHPSRTVRCFGILLKSSSVDVFTDNIAVFLKGLWLARIARKWGADHIHSHWGTATSTVGLIASKLTEIPWSLTFHRYDILENQNLIMPKLAAASFARFISESGLEMIKTLDIGALAEKCRVLHLGVNMPDREELRLEECHTQERVPILLCPANLNSVKGHKYLIDACKILSDEGVDVQIWLAGKGELRGELDKYVSSLLLADKVHFLGEIPHSEILEMYSTRAVDVVVLPSIILGHGCHEGIPVSLMEAMSYGIPVVSTATGGIPELIGEGAGMMVPDKDAVALAEAVKRVVCDQELYCRLSASGRNRVEEQFNVQTIARQLTNLFDQSMP